MTLPRRADLWRAAGLRGLGGDDQVRRIDVKAFALRPIARRLMRTWPPRGQHVEQLFLDPVARPAGGATRSHHETRGVRAPPDRQPMHFSELAVRTQQ